MDAKFHVLIFLVKQWVIGNYWQVKWMKNVDYCTMKIICDTFSLRDIACVFVPLTLKWKIICNKYYVMNYSINSFTGASEATVNVVVVVVY